MRKLADYLCSIFILIMMKRSTTASPHWFLESLPMSSLAQGGLPVTKSVDRLCESIPGLVQQQYRMCKSHPEIVLTMSDGTKKGLIECVKQFKFERWNCSALTYNKPAAINGVKKIIQKGTKESAFLYAISSAGVVYAITRSCSQGNLRECQCDPKRKGQSADDVGLFTWGGCSEHIRFGMKMARMFMDAKDKQKMSLRSLMNLHNNKVGRRSVWRKKIIKCKCHGVSGACSMRTCWRKMKDFSAVGDIVKKGYDKAVKAALDRRMNRLYDISRGPRRKPSRSKLVYMEESPNYCQFDTRIGHPGIGGRECNKTSTGEDSCDTLCCDRGYDTFVMDVKENCDCKFYWCCHVKCKICHQKVMVHKCKTLAEDSLNYKKLEQNLLKEE